MASLVAFKPRSAGVAIPSFPYTAPTNGWALLLGKIGDRTFVNFKIDGYLAMDTGNSSAWTSFTSNLIYIAKGQIIASEGNPNMGRCWFYPQ